MVKKDNKATSLKVASAIGVAALVVSGALNVAYKSDVNEANAQNIASVAKITDLNETVKSITDISVNQGIAIEDLNSQLADLTVALDAKDQEVIDLAKEISVEVAGSSNTGYSIDEVSLIGNFAKILKDDKVAVLLDTEIDFAGDDYKIEEVIEINSSFAPLTSAVIDNEFGSNIYVGSTEKDSVGYKYVFKDVDKINFSTVTEDEDLTISFLGKELKIISADAGTLTYQEVSKSFAVIGETTDFGVKVLNIGDGSVLVEYQGETEVLKENETHSFDDIEIKIDSIFYDDIKADRIVVIQGGEDLTKTVVSGDSMEIFGEPKNEVDALWVWDINFDAAKPFVGVKLNQRLDDLGDNFKPLAIGEQLVLPNDYVAITYIGQNVVDYNKLTASFDRVDINTMDNVETLVVKSSTGNILADGNNYNTLYVTASNVYVKEDSTYIVVTDYVLELEDDQTIALDVGTNSFSVGGFISSLDFANELITNVDYIGGRNTMEEDLVLNNGIVVSSPEDAYDNDELAFDIPVEKVKLELSVE